MIIDCLHGKFDIQWPNDYIAQQLIQHGSYEYVVVEQLLELVGDQSGLILDVGANIGTVSIPLARLCSNCTIHAWEIQPGVIECLHRNIQLNSLTNIQVHEYALGDREQTISVPEHDYAAATNIGAFSLNPEVWANSPMARSSGPRMSVRCCRLDDSKFDQPIRAIKLDVEGQELSVIQGALKTLAEHDYPPIVYEAWSYNPWWESNADQLRGFLINLGYQLRQIDDTIIAHHA